MHVPTNPASRALILGIAAFVVLGMTDGAIGTVWPDLRDEFGQTDGSFGQVFVCLAGGYMVASLLSGHLSDRFGMAAVIRVGSAGAMVALMLIGTGWTWPTTLAGFALLGLGNGLLDACEGNPQEVVLGFPQNPNALVPGQGPGPKLACRPHRPCHWMGLHIRRSN